MLSPALVLALLACATAHTPGLGELPADLPPWGAALFAKVGAMYLIKRIDGLGWTRSSIYPTTPGRDSQDAVSSERVELAENNIVHASSANTSSRSTS